jgi:ribosomal protein S12 methylthiotransferase accessory factor
MEAMESAFAEDHEALVSLFSSVNELRQEGMEIVPLQRLSRCRFEDVDASQRLGWVRGTSLKAGREVVAPFELIGLDYTEEKKALSAGFRMSTIGLGAGKTWDEAVCHALMELIEHDAVAVLELIPAFVNLLPAGRYEPGFSKNLDDAVALFKSAGIEPTFRAVSNHIGFPVVMCSIPRFHSEGTGRDRICAGFACRQSVGDAALAALLEAAQVRMTLIAGAREDLKLSDYERGRQFASLDPSPMDVSCLFTSAPETPATKHNVKQLLQGLEQAGVDNLYVFPLNRPGDPIHVVRVLVEGLAVADQESGIDLGQRAITTLLKPGFVTR